MSLTRLGCFIVFLIAFTYQVVQASPRMVIANNGAGKGLIENSLPAATFAVALGVEYLELHVVMTADDQLLAFHDLTLDRLTDVAE
ncbi:MAG: glycerophosphodiester phosphodiesterase family protein, partial [Pseudomonadota bacterium]